MRNAEEISKFPRHLDGRGALKIPCPQRACGFDPHPRQISSRCLCLCGLRYAGYSFTDQVISELSAIGAPTSALWEWLLQIFAVLFAAFTIGVVRDSSGNRRLRVTGWLLIGFVGR